MSDRPRLKTRFSGLRKAAPLLPISYPVIQELRLPTVAHSVNATYVTPRQSYQATTGVALVAPRSPSSGYDPDSLAPKTPDHIEYLNDYVDPPPVPPLDRVWNERKLTPPTSVSSEKSSSASVEKQKTRPPPLDLGVSSFTSAASPPLSNPFQHEEDYHDDPLPVIQHVTHGEGYRYPSWPLRPLRPGDTIAASHSSDLGQSALHDVLLTPVPVQFHPSPVPDTFLQSAAKAAKRTSRVVVEYARSVPLPSALKSEKNRSDRGERRVRVHLPSVSDHGWEDREPVRHEKFWRNSVITHKERQHQKCTDKINKKNKKKRTIFLVIVLLILVGTIIGLCVSLLGQPDQPDKSHGTAATAAPSASATVASTVAPSASIRIGSTIAAPVAADTIAAPVAADTIVAPVSTATEGVLTPLGKCLADFGTSTRSYDCSACTPILSAAPNDFSDPNGTAGVGPALQYCTLMDILAEASDPSDLKAGRWGEDTSPCSSAWSGLVCDTRGRIMSLNLGAITTVPDSIRHLVGLSSLTINGNSTLPSDKLPIASIQSLTSLAHLQIQNTALIGPIDTLNFTALPLQSLYLVNNTALGSNMPDLSLSKTFTSYVFSGHGVKTLNTDAIPPSVSYLDLSLNAISGQVPNFATLPALETLYLNSNNFTTPPSSLSMKIASLNLSNNPNLAGTLPLAFCASTALTTCELKGTKMYPTVSSVRTCGPCTLH